MVTIKCSVYEKHDLLEFLDYCKKKKTEDCNKGIITPYLLKIELNNIEKLKQRVNGFYVEDYTNSSIEFNRNQPRQRTSNDDLLDLK